MAGNIYLPILSTFNGAGVKQAQGALAGLAGTVRSLGASFKAAAVGFVAFQSVSGLANFATGTIVQARDLERNVRALELVFDDATGRMKEFVATANTMGLSQSQAAQASTFLGSVLRGAGFDTAKTATETERLVSLASDLATVYGYDVSEALSGMTALFRGEYDPIEKFGVAMKQSEVNAVLAAKGLGKLTGQELLNAQQQVRLELLYQRTARAQGAFAKGAGTLFVEQKKLESAFKDFEAQLGGKLTPVITEFMMALQPMLEGGTGAGLNFFQGLADTMDALMPLLKPVGDLFNIIIDVLGDLMIAFAPLIEIISISLGDALNFLMPALAFIGETFSVIARIASAVLSPVLDILAITFKIILGVAGTFLGMFKPLVDPVMSFIGFVVKGLEDFARGFRSVTKMIVDGPEFRAKSSIRSIEGADPIIPMKSPPPPGPGKNYVADFFNNIKDEIKKQNARLKLENLGASEALISSILSGEGWGTVYAKIVKGGAAGVAALQAQFNKTSAGMKEIADAAKLASDSMDELAQRNADSLDRLKDEYLTLSEAGAELVKNNKEVLRSFLDLFSIAPEMGEFERTAVDAFSNIFGEIKSALAEGLIDDAAAASLNALTDSAVASMQAIGKQRDVLAGQIAVAKEQIATSKALVEANDSLMKSFMDIFAIVPEMGQFEKAANDSFKSIFDQISSAVGNGSILESAGKSLTKFAETTRNSLMAIARQRDVLGEKINIAKTVYSGVVGLANITSFLKTTTETVTETVKKIVDGISLATTRTFQLVSSGGLVDNFQALVDKTKAFARNLMELKRLGLNRDLFAQLVRAGADAGGATAQAIIDGGSDTVGALNDLYSQLGDVANDISAGVTDTLYEVGTGVVNSGFINGLLSQDTVLADAATSMANSFATSFTTSLKTAVTEKLPDLAGLIAQDEALKLQAKSLAETFATAFGDALASSIAATLAKLMPPTAPVENWFPEESGAVGGGTMFSAMSVGKAKVFEVNINAGMVTDKAELGQTIVDTISRYERTNGSVWVRA